MTFMDKHAPQSLRDMVFVDAETRQRVEQYAHRKRSGHIVLKGPKGTAKSTTARIIAEAAAKHDGSDYCATVFQAADMDETHIEQLEKEWNYGRIYGMNPPYAIIEEVDQLSPRHQRKLRATLDSRPFGHVIMTTNNDHLVDGPLLDRCDVLEMPAANMKQWMFRAREVIESEGVDITDAQLRRLLNTCNGSIRDLMRALEDYVIARK